VDADDELVPERLGQPQEVCVAEMHHVVAATNRWITFRLFKTTSDTFAVKEDEVCEDRTR
jgi:hypothetical protein